jgi:hypothetical protein
MAAIDAAMGSAGLRGNVGSGATGGGGAGGIGGGTGGERLVDAFRGLRLDSPRGPIEVDAHTRDIVQNVYIRRVVRSEGRWVNREFERFERVRDPGV